MLLTRRFWPLADGPARNMANVGAALADHGHHVTVLSARWRRSGRQKRCLATCDWCTAPPPRSGWNMVRWIKATARWMAARRDQIDLIYVSGLQHEAYAALGAVRSRACVVLRAESAGPRGDCQWQRGCALRAARRIAMPPVGRRCRSYSYDRRRVDCSRLSPIANPRTGYRRTHPAGPGPPGQDRS